MIFFITAAITVYMTSEYNKARDCQNMSAKFSSAGNFILSNESFVKKSHQKFKDCRICQFPFKYKGQEFNDCVTEENGTPWCANMVDENRNYIQGQTVECPKSSCKQCTYKATSSTLLIRKIYLSDQGKQHRNSSAYVALISKMYIADQKADENIDHIQGQKVECPIFSCKQCNNKGPFICFANSQDTSYLLNRKQMKGS